RRRAHERPAGCGRPRHPVEPDRGLPRPVALGRSLDRSGDHHPHHRHRHPADELGFRDRGSAALRFDGPRRNQGHGRDPALPRHRGDHHRGQGGGPHRGRTRGHDTAHPHRRRGAVGRRCQPLRIGVNDNVSPLGSPDAASEPDCSLPGPRAAGAVTTGSVEYAETDKGTDGITACYPFAGPGVDELDGAEVAPGSARGQLITDDAGPVPLTVIGNADWVTNEHIDEEGNASLVLSELSHTDNLVVYYPTFDDAAQPPPSTIDFVPSWFLAGGMWLIPCTLVLLLVLGRRFGPLAVERLPVIVPAVETVHGRAALSARSHDRAGALHTLRTAALLRIAKRFSLGSEARTEDIIARLAAATGRDPGHLHHVFVSGSARTDAELTDLVHQLAQIESEVP